MVRLYNQSSALSASDSSQSSWEDEMGAHSDQLFFVNCYSDFEKLAHGPRGTEASKCLYVYRFHPTDGSMVLCNIDGDKNEVMNPAFSRYHPSLNVVYTCTEDIQDNGQVIAYSVASNGALTKIGQVDAGGTSTCYLTIDKAGKHLIATNYWDSTLAVIPLDPNTGAFAGPVKSMYDPKGGKAMVAAAKKDGGVNHSLNDSSTIQMRQADPHSHALVLDPFVGTVAYVPDLGKDLVREFYYNTKTGSFDLEFNILPSGLCTGQPDGPRYIDFHPTLDIAYVINELSCTIAVFTVDRSLINEISKASANNEDMEQFKGRSTLKLIQSIKTVPSAFPTSLNTCGRIAVHRSGRYVLVSNRGHESIAIFRVHTKGSKAGELSAVGYFHTRGETPRHFNFDNSGQYLIVANQDTDSLAIFSFNLSSGEIKFTGNEYRLPSPNFVCNCPVYDESGIGLVGESASENNARVHIDLGSSSGSDSDADNSTTPTNKDDKESLRKELNKARREIEELRQKLASV
mmetsp:Transcript_20524/g.28551  ORF Transcript_20524/g.28551 Transcript_20524/m.28551 type:complete len:515 (+) Transcript_20524:204-1748(+)